MKKLGVISSALLFTLCAGTLDAQTMDRVRLGYCEDLVGGGLVAQTDKPSEFGAAIKLPNSTLKKYVGAKIDEIEFAVGDNVVEMMTVIVTRELGGKPIYTQSLKEVKQGWNRVKLNRPYTIKEEDELYVGYVFYCSADNVGREVIKFEYSPGATAGVNFFSQDNRWMATPESIDFDLSIRAYAEGNNLPHTDVGVVSLKASDIIKQNAETDFKLKVLNYGLDVVRSVKVEVIANGKVFDEKAVADIALSNNHEMELDIQDVKFPEEGNNELAVRVSAVNGTDDSDISDNERTKSLYAVRENGNPVLRQVLFEEFTTESDEASIIADSIYRAAATLQKGVIWVKHHTDDPYELPWESPYARFFDNNQMFHPAVMFDRTTFGGMKEFGPAYFLSTAEEVGVVVQACKSVPSFIEPSLECSYEAASGELTITAKGKAEVKEMPFQTDLRLTVYVVEDKVRSLTQKGSDEYFHNGVVRTSPNEDCFGDKIAIQNYAFEKKYTVNVPREWNPDNLRIVAFVSNYDAKDNQKLWSYNAVEKSLQTSGIDAAVLEGGRAPKIVVIDGRLVLEEGYSLVDVYHLMGAKVSSESLDKGFYLVRTTDGSRVYTSKVIVR